MIPRPARPAPSPEAIGASPRSPTTALYRLAWLTAFSLSVSCLNGPAPPDSVAPAGGGTASAPSGGGPGTGGENSTGAGGGQGATAPAGGAPAGAGGALHAGETSGAGGDAAVGGAGGLAATGGTSGAGGDAAIGGAPGAGGSPTKSLLLLTKTAGFRHTSIPAGINATLTLAAPRNIGVTATEDTELFTQEGLRAFDAVMFLSTTGDILAPDQEQALRSYLEAGGGFIGVHAATDTEPDWTWFREYLGAHFADHPAVQPASIQVEKPDHPATRTLPDPWERVDEWYNFDVNPRATVEVLLSLDESSYSGGTMGDHPIAWARERDGGRLFYTALGHTAESFEEPAFLSHLAGGIAWVLGLPE